MAEFIQSCPQCNSELQVQDEWQGMKIECPLCRNEFVVAKPALQIHPAFIAAQPYPQQPFANAKPCPFCGNMVEYQAAFCMHCGQRLNQIPPNNPHAATGAGRFMPNGAFAATSSEIKRANRHVAAKVFSFMIGIISMGFIFYFANKVYVEAEYNKGLHYCKEEYLYDFAAESFTKAAAWGHTKALYSLGICYYVGGGTFGKNLRKAAKLFQKAADKGLAEAQLDLGKCYLLGQGVKKDSYKAAELFRKAADQGLAKAQGALGVCYMYGHGVERNVNLAAEWFKKAAAQGNHEAIEFLKRIKR